MLLLLLLLQALRSQCMLGSLVLCGRDAHNNSGRSWESSAWLASCPGSQRTFVVVAIISTKNPIFIHFLLSGGGDRFLRFSNPEADRTPISWVNPVFNNGSLIF